MSHPFRRILCGLLCTGFAFAGLAFAFTSPEDKPISSPQKLGFPLVEESRLPLGGDSLGHIVRAGSTLYLATRDGKVQAVDAQKKELLWKTNLPAPLSSPPAVGEKTIVVYDERHVVYGLDRSGKLLWSRRVEQVPAGPLLVVKGRVILGTESGLVLALDEASGGESWQYQSGGPVLEGAVGWTAGRQTMIIFGCGDGNLYLLDFNGRPRGAIAIGSPVAFTPQVEGDHIYLGAADRTFRCYHLPSRKLEWQHNLGGVAASRSVVDEKRVCVVVSNGVLFCLSRSRGDILWWKAVPSRVFYAPEAVGGLVLVSSQSTTFTATEFETGKIAGSFATSGQLASNLIWTASRLSVVIVDPRKRQSTLLFLARNIKAALSPSKASPVKAGEEVVFKATSVGLDNPRFRFVLVTGGTEQVVQEASAVDSWTWYPDQEGLFKVSVKVEGENGSAEATIEVQVKSKKDAASEIVTRERSLR